jgi:hypothetical protein
MVIRAGALIDVGDFVVSDDSISLSGGVASASCTVYRRGMMATVIMQFAAGTLTSGTAIGTLPTGYRPITNTIVPLTVNSSSGPISVFCTVVSSSGVMTFNAYGGSITSTFRGIATWPVAS